MRPFADYEFSSRWRLLKMMTRLESCLDVFDESSAGFTKESSRQRRLGVVVANEEDDSAWRAIIERMFQ